MFRDSVRGEFRAQGLVGLRAEGSNSIQAFASHGTSGVRE